MTREEHIKKLKDILSEATETEDAVCYVTSEDKETLEAAISALSHPKTGQCKDCKWWKDSDGLYRRGSHAESQCPINRREVFEGNGYCYMFEPQERNGEE